MKQLKETKNIDEGFMRELQIDLELRDHMWHILLNHLEKCIETLDIFNGSHKVKSIRAHLRSKDQFLNTLSEIEIAYLFKVPLCASLILSP